MHVGDPLESQGGQGAFHGLALWIEDARLRPDQHTRPHADRSSHAWKGSPVMRSYASTYSARVRSITSSGSAGAGGVLSHPELAAQSRTYCLSKLGWPWPGSYPSAGQKRDESGVITSSPSTIVPSGRRPNSNLVSARMIPRSRACAAPSS